MPRLPVGLCSSSLLTTILFHLSSIRSHTSRLTLHCELSSMGANDGYLGGRNSSFGESEGRRSMLDISWSCISMSLTSPGTSWVLEEEGRSRSRLLTGLLAPFFFAEDLRGGRQIRGACSWAVVIGDTGTHPTLLPCPFHVPRSRWGGGRGQSVNLSHVAREEEGSTFLPLIITWGFQQS